MPEWAGYFAGWYDYSPAIRSIVQGLLGMGAIAWFAYSVIHKVGAGRDFDAEQKKARSDLRRRNSDLESEVSRLQGRTVEVERASAAYEATVRALHERLAEGLDREKKVLVDLRLTANARDDAVAYCLRLQEKLYEVAGLGAAVSDLKKENDALNQQLGRLRTLLHQVRFYLEGCGGCQNPAVLRSIRASLPAALGVERHDLVEVPSARPPSEASEGV